MSSERVGNIGSFLASTFTMASTVMRNGINRFQWQRPFREMASTVSNGNDRLRKGNLRRRPRSRCLKSLLSTPGWRVYLLSKKFEEILGSFLCFVCAFRFLFIFFIKWDITVILQLRRGSKFGRLFERKSDAVEFPFVIWTPTNRIKKRRSSLDDAYRHYPPFVDQNTTEGTLRSCGVSYTEIFLAVSQTILSNIFVGAWL